MKVSEPLLGLTPILKRLAFYYLRKGVGSHAIDHPQYDEVIVRDLYDWHAPENRDLLPQGGLVVEFCFLGKRVRWVEFGARCIGGGGDTVMKLT